MNETFWGLYEAQIGALKACTSPEEANLIMLETAKLLVEHIDLSEETVRKYDKFGVRKLFAAHNALGGAVTSFYESKKDFLDPTAQAGAIGQRITAITEKITATSDSLQQLQVLEKNLFEKEAELSALEKELDAWKQKAAHLRDIEANTVDEIQQYQKQFQQLDATVSQYAEELAFWEAHLGEDCAIVEKMRVYGVASVSELINSIEKLKANIRQDLSALDVVIKKVVEQEAQVREAVLRKQNKMV